MIEQREDVTVIDVTLWCPVCGDECEQRPPSYWVGDGRPAQRHIIDASALCLQDGVRAFADIREIVAERGVE